jgi:hypothetical protein
MVGLCTVRSGVTGCGRAGSGCQWHIYKSRGMFGWVGSGQV